MDLYYDLVPKDVCANLEYRIEIRERAESDRQFRRALMQACAADVLYWLNSCCWLYEPRPMVVDGYLLPTQIPFITWSHQDEPIRQMRANLGQRDIGCEKSRGQGASWIGILLALHDWLFVPGAKVSLVSSSEKKTDDPDDADSLFWKIDQELKWLPEWMAGKRDVDWKRNIQHHALVNIRNGASITGYACTGDIARGGRARWFLMDELASWPRGQDENAMRSTQQVTKSRLIVSTPEGTDGAYYRAMHEPSNMIKLVLDWKDNPWQNRGLYRHVGSKMVAVDPVNNPLPANYENESKDMASRLRSKGFKLAGELRSPWYDNECDRTNATPQSIAKELDRDYGGSMYRVFGSDFFEKAERNVMQPFMRGVLSYNKETLVPEWDAVDNGPMLLWTKLDAGRKPPKHSYVVGADLSSGLGGSYTSNSVAEVIDVTTMEQVFEYATNTVSPSDFADFCIALAHWFHDAYLIWEHNGPGSGFTSRVKDHRYPNVYMREVMWVRGKKKHKAMGWWTNRETKERLFQELMRSVKTEEVKTHSDMLVKECGQYVRSGPQGKIEHILSISTEDDSSRGEAHGDRVMAFGVCLQGARDRPVVRQIKKADGVFSMDDPPPFTIAARQKEYEDRLRSDAEPWDPRSNYDMMVRR